MAQTYLVGVDLGTTGTKAAIFDSAGNLVADSYEESRLYYPRPAWVEQNPDEIYDSAMRTIRACLDKSGIAARDIAAISFDGQMAGIGSVDRDWGTPTMYDSWLDTRCEPYIQVMKRHQELVVDKTGGPPTYSHGPKILWWMHERPDVFDRIAKFVVPGGYVAGRMAGLRGDQAFMDYTYIHFSCLSDTRAATWSPELCSLFNVPAAKLPRIVRPWEIIGHVTQDAARASGLYAGTPIAAGCGDQAAGMLGAAMVEPGLVFDVAGTASVFAVCTEDFCPDVEHKTLFTAHLVPPDLWYSLAYINGGGLNLRWFRDEIAREEKAQAEREGRSFYARFDEMAASLPPGSDGLIFIPHLSGRVCPNEPGTRGLWMGFTWAHRKEHFYRSLLEGVAYEYALYLSIERQLFPSLAFKEARVIGGGSSSAVWNQIKADVLGIPYVRLNRQEFGVLGSAVLAGYAVGVFDDLKATARSFVHATDRIEPRTEYHSLYQHYVRLYASLLDTLRGAYHALATARTVPELKRQVPE